MPDAPSFDDLYRAQFAYVWHSLRRLGIPSADLADAAHDTFVAVHARRATYDPTRPVRPWLFAIAYRIAADRRDKDRTAREFVADAFDLPAAAAPSSPDDPLSDEQTRESVLAALRTLDIERRAVIILHDIDEIPIAQIALALDVPDKTLHSRLRIAREQFAAAMKRLAE